MEHKNYIKDFRSNIIKHLSNSIKCLYRAKIVKLHKASADIQPLAVDIQHRKLPKVDDVPFGIVPTTDERQKRKTKIKPNLSITTDIHGKVPYLDKKGRTKYRELTIKNAHFKIPTSVVTDLIPSYQQTKPKLDYHVGDNVIVGVLDNDDEYYQDKSLYQIERNDRHSIDYSVILFKHANENDFVKR